MIPGYLLNIDKPRIVQEALKLHGTIEAPGSVNDEVIMSWAKELGIEKIYNADEIPWCGLFLAIICLRAGFKPVKNFLWALSWCAWGTPIETPMLGDILIFKRSQGGHVGLYVGEDGSFYQVLGGNQSDQVCIRSFPKERLYAARRCPWKFFQPKSVKRVFTSLTALKSNKEN